MTLAFHDQSKGITTIINAVFNVLVDAEIRRVKPSDYCLFQVADLFCTLELAKLKLDSQGLSKSEDEFFRGPRAFKKNYWKPSPGEHPVVYRIDEPRLAEAIAGYIDLRQDIGTAVYSVSKSAGE